MRDAARPRLAVFALDRLPEIGAQAKPVIHPAHQHLIGHVLVGIDDLRAAVVIDLGGGWPANRAARRSAPPAPPGLGAAAFATAGAALPRRGAEGSERSRGRRRRARE